MFSNATWGSGQSLDLAPMPNEVSPCVNSYN